MNIVNCDYKKYQLDLNVALKFSLEFIKKHGFLPYSIVKNVLVILVYEIDVFKLNKINFYGVLDYQLVKISKLEWQNIFNRIEVVKNQKKAIINYENDFKVLNNFVKENHNEVLYDAEVGNSPIVKLIDSILSEAIMMKASDVHIEPSSEIINVRFRIDGKLLSKTEIKVNSLNEIVSRIKVMASLDITKKLVPQDGKIPYVFNDTEYDIRVSLIPTIYGERVALRILDFNEEGLKLKDLGISKEMMPDILKLISSPLGLILVCGPTGSGKSTTLQAFLKKNVTNETNIITVEDPVEYTINGVSQVQINEAAGLSFAACLRSILRQDPNIIMIGEIRDKETAQIACRASITGHLVYSTLHTNTSIGVINRLLDMDIEPYLLVDALKGIISQRLVRVLCPKCKKKEVVSEEIKQLYSLNDLEYIYKAKGCSYCNNTGYKGRTSVYELLIIDDDFKSIIAKGGSFLDYAKVFKQKKLLSLYDSGLNLVRKGVTSLDEINACIENNY